MQDLSQEPSTVPNQEKIKPPMLSTKKLSIEKDWPEASLNSGRSGYGPFRTLPFVRIGRKIMYRREDIEIWIEARITTGEASRAARIGAVEK